LTTASAVVYYMVTMYSWSQNPLCRHAATPRQIRILRDPYLGVAQVLHKNEAENEAEQFIEKAWLTEAEKANLSNLLKTNDRVWGRFFVENEAEHLVENKRH
jgi:hypothetical protein